MDPMDFILHQPPRQPGYYDPVHSPPSSSSSHWTLQHHHNNHHSDHHNHNNHHNNHSNHNNHNNHHFHNNHPSFLWQSPSPPIPFPFPHHTLQPIMNPGSDPFHIRDQDLANNLPSLHRYPDAQNSFSGASGSIYGSASGSGPGPLPSSGRGPGSFSSSVFGSNPTSGSGTRSGLDLNDFGRDVPPAHYHQSLHRNGHGQGPGPGFGPVSTFAQRQASRMAQNLNENQPQNQNVDGPFGSQPPLGRPLTFQHAPALGPPHAAASSEHNTLHRLPYSMMDGAGIGTGLGSGLGAGIGGSAADLYGFGAGLGPGPGPGPGLGSGSGSGSGPALTYHSLDLSSALPNQPQTPHQVASRRAQPLISSTSRTREVSSPSRHSPSSSSNLRRSQPRARRAMSRNVSADLGRGDDDDPRGSALVQRVLDSATRPDGSVDEIAFEEGIMRQLQVVRGAISCKMVVSKQTLRSLQSVDISELAEADRSCVICYNEFGVDTPEGIREAPLRLPKCKHIFGDYCIKRWFENSDSCPYCRDKLHAEPKVQPIESSARARTFMNLMRMRGHALVPGLDPDSLASASSLPPRDGDRSGPSTRQYTMTRRLPIDSEREQQRRTRARHNDTEPSSSSPSSRLDQVSGGSWATRPSLGTAGAFGGMEQMTGRGNLPPIRQRVQRPADWPLEPVEHFRQSVSAASTAVPRPVQMGANGTTDTAGPAGPTMSLPSLRDPVQLQRQVPARRSRLAYNVEPLDERDDDDSLNPGS